MLEHYRTLPQIFNSGLRLARPKSPFLVHAPLSLSNLSSSRTTTSGRYGKRLTREDEMSVAPSKVFFKSGAVVRTSGLDTVNPALDRQSGNSVFPLIGVTHPDPPLYSLIYRMANSQFSYITAQQSSRPSL